MYLILFVLGRYEGEGDLPDHKDKRDRPQRNKKTIKRTIEPKKKNHSGFYHLLEVVIMMPFNYDETQK